MEISIRPANQPDDPPFLVLQKYHLSRGLAKDAVIRLFGELGVRKPATGWESLNITWKDDKGQTPVSFTALVQEAREFGTVLRLQRYLDKKDSVFGGGIDELGTPTHQLRIETQYAGFCASVEGPCRTASVELDLSEDILHFRADACLFSNQHDFKLVSRAYRSYLSACVSITDAFINRHILLASHEGFTSPEFEELKQATNSEQRFRLWFTCCSDDDPNPFFASLDWCHFQELRKKRNEILHALNPVGMYSLKEMQLYLNKVRTGIGGLLWRMRKAHKKPTLGFIERLRTAPPVDFMQITFRADGNHKSKRVVGR